jgi:hypothetical protein|tara:strand:+ start:231 stop:491 length:261 start_codon:yes stop_codon:yes gene_type:complete
MKYKAYIAVENPKTGLFEKKRKPIEIDVNTFNFQEASGYACFIYMKHFMKSKVLIPEKLKNGTTLNRIQSLKVYKIVYLDLNEVKK